MLIFCWLLPFIVKIDAAAFELNVRYYSQDITKKQFQQQLTAPQHKPLFAIRIWKKNTLFNTFHVKSLVLHLIVFLKGRRYLQMSC